MPCYCDIPYSNDQKEIEKRCKEKMYVDAQKILTKEQVIECEKNNLKKYPFDKINEYLCKICKILTEDQMKKISAYYFQIEWDHKTLYDWHVKHCQDDKKFNMDSE